MNVYSRGQAVDPVISSGGSMTVYRGGIVDGADIRASGVATVSDGLFISGTNSWALYIRGGTCVDLYTPGTTYGVQGEARRVSGGGVLTASGGFFVDTISGGVVYVRGGTVANAVVVSAKTLIVSSGFASSTIVSSGGSMTVSSGGSADVTEVKSGGLLTVSSGGLALNVTAENSDDVVVIEGGTIYPPIG